MKSNPRFVLPSSLTPLICRVCGDTARGNNFQAVSCMSCKLFFRRNALLPSETLSCKRDGHCNINTATRRKCPACRLQKCFTVGMNARLIRLDIRRQISINDRRGSPVHEENSILSSCRSFQNDNLPLTPEQWRILSHAIHGYDETNPVGQMKSFLASQSSLPPKLRFKPSAMLDMIASFVRAIQRTIEQSSYYQSLSTNGRPAGMKHHFKQLSSKRWTTSVS